MGVMVPMVTTIPTGDSKIFAKLLALGFTPDTISKALSVTEDETPYTVIQGEPPVSDQEREARLWWWMNQAVPERLKRILDSTLLPE